MAKGNPRGKIVIELIEYNGKNYPTRWINSPDPEYGIVRIATADLLEAMEERYNELGTVEAKIDSQFTFYVMPNEIILSEHKLQKIIED